ncbi:MAG TPA: acyl-ACP--UDP-N-acetylglucosamine O-acyltransferase [Gammaproteobacteria bacterium]|nr:acyl-ACP--UDP-N-acetylglucosamine O-acyltransferase [Gammaproteobacteria bacterium]
MGIHATAIVSADADIASTAEIGPFCVIEGRVSIGADTVVESHARIGSVYGQVTIGEKNLVQCGAVLGGPAQDYSYGDGKTELVIGNGNRIGEYVSISLGTVKGGGTTRIGDNNFIMAFAHLGHDCQVADHVVITNGTQLAGHVTVEHHALLSGLVGVTQFVRIGAYSFLVGGAFANKDILPYTIAEGHWATPKAVNRVGLKRAGFNLAQRKNIEKAIRIALERKTTIEDVANRIRSECEQDEPIAHLLAFIAGSERGVARA